MKNKRKHFGLSDYVALGVALIGAVILWIYAIGFDSTVFTRTIDNVNVTVVGAEELAANNGFSLKQEMDFSISVKISGRRTDIGNIKSSDLSATVDVSGVTAAGYNTLPITVTVPNGVTVADQSSSSASLFLDRFITKTVAVKPMHTISSVVADVRIESEICNPSVLMISGPESVLDTVDYVSASYAVGELSGNVIAYCSPVIIDNQGRAVNNAYVSIDEQDIIVALSVYKEKTVPVEVQFTGGLFNASVATIELSADQIKIKGDVSTVDALSKLTITIDETQYKQNIELDVETKSILPLGITIGEGEPETIRVSATIPEISKRTFTVAASDVKITSGSDEYIVSSDVVLTVVGPTRELNTLSYDDITVSIDAKSHLTAEDGRYYAVASVTVNGLSFYSVTGGEEVYLGFATETDNQ